MRTLAVIGSGGMLGLAVTSFFRGLGDRVDAIDRATHDIARDPLSALEPRVAAADAVINCAGVIKPRIADTPIEDVLRVNAVFPRNLARLCAVVDTPLFHVTTDCVFSGDRGAYTENDYVDAEDVYGLSKSGGDTADAMVLRTSIIGEERGQRRSLLEWARSQAGGRVKGFVNHRWNGVTTLHLAQIVRRILDERVHARGIFHVHSPEVVDKHELLRLIDEVYELGLTIEPVDAPRPCDRSLASVKPLSARVADVPLRRQLAEMREFFAGLDRA